MFSCFLKNWWSIFGELWLFMLNVKNGCREKHQSESRVYFLMNSHQQLKLSFHANFAIYSSSLIILPLSRALKFDWAALIPILNFRWLSTAVGLTFLVTALGEIHGEIAQNEFNANVLILFENRSFHRVQGREGWFVHSDRLMIIRLYLSFYIHLTLVLVICAADILTRDITKRSILSQEHSWAPGKPFSEAVHSCSAGMGFFYAVAVVFLLQFNGFSAYTKSDWLNDISVQY